MLNFSGFNPELQAPSAKVILTTLVFNLLWNSFCENSLTVFINLKFVGRYTINL